MLSSNMMPVMLPRPAPVFQQSTFPLGMYPPSLMFHPSHLLPTMASSLPVRGAQLPTTWNPSLGYPTSSPPLKSSALMPSPTFRAFSAGSPSPPVMATMKSPGSSICRSRYPSPPCSPDSASSTGGEKTAFTIDAILSSNKRSPSSTSGGSSRSGYGSDRGLTPSPDSFHFASPNSTSPSKIWNSSCFQAADFRCGSDRSNVIGDYHFDSRCDSKLRSTSVPVTIIESQEDQLMRKAIRNTDKGLKRLRCDDDEWNPRSKRVRTIFTQDQLERLEQEFDRQQYMVGSERLYLAAELSLTESQVKVWFQNRRIKWRKQNFEKQQVQLAQIRPVESSEHREVDRTSDEDNELVNDHSSSVSGDETRVRFESKSVENSDFTTTIAEQSSVVNGSDDDLEQSVMNATPSSGSVTSSTTESYSASLHEEVKRVEERLAMRLCRRNMIQSSTSSSSLSSSSHFRFMSSIRSMESSRDIEYKNIVHRQ